MWIPLSKGPHWSRKRPFSDDNNDFMLPPHLMKKPKTEVLDAENMFLNGIELGHSSIQGFRVSMEDAHIIDCFDSMPDHTVAAILDGHAGDQTALYASTRLLHVIEETEQEPNMLQLCWAPQKDVQEQGSRVNERSGRGFRRGGRGKEKWLKTKQLNTNNPGAKKSKGEDKIKTQFLDEQHTSRNSVHGTYVNTDAELDLLSQAVVQAYVNMDDELRKLENVSVSGSTCVLVIITPSHILCANVGDSRCVLGTKIEKKNQIHNVCIALSEDHKPSLPEEKLRISEAGGFVADDRVNGELAMSRALGDFVYKGNVELAADKQAVICYPDIAIQRRTPHDGVLILACDGVWDVVSNDDAVSYLQDIVLQSSSEKTNSNNKNENGKNKTGVRCQEAAQSLVSLSLGMGSMDNISVIAVNFQPNPQALAAEE